MIPEVNNTIINPWSPTNCLFHQTALLCWKLSKQTCKIFYTDVFVLHSIMMYYIVIFYRIFTSNWIVIYSNVFILHLLYWSQLICTTNLPNMAITILDLDSEWWKFHIRSRLFWIITDLLVVPAFKYQWDFPILVNHQYVHEFTTGQIIWYLYMIRFKM